MPTWLRNVSVESCLTWLGSPDRRRHAAVGPLAPIVRGEPLSDTTIEASGYLMIDSAARLPDRERVCARR